MIVVDASILACALADDNSDSSRRDVLTSPWRLRQNLTPYDAAYVALAELLDVVLVTGDKRLSRSPGLRCRVQVIG